MQRAAKVFGANWHNRIADDEAIRPKLAAVVHSSPRYSLCKTKIQFSNKELVMTAARKFFALLFLALLLAGGVSQARGLTEDQLQALTKTQLTDLKKDFRASFMRPPEHRLVQGVPVSNLFTDSQIAKQSFKDLKWQSRTKLQTRDGFRYQDQGARGRAGIRQNISDFLDQAFLSSYRPLIRLEDMESAGLRKANAATYPWSDTYWPYNEGLISARYADLGFQTQRRVWESFYQYSHQARPLAQVLTQPRNPEEINNLSPAEKYDQLLGAVDLQFSPFGIFSEKVWAQVLSIGEAGEAIENWMGICQGWAAAAIMEARPKHTIEVASDHGSLRLFPSDLKGLLTYQWTRAKFPARFMGGRCSTKDPERASSGRVTSEECWDINPALWHMAAVNMLGQAGRSFVLDATFDYEVWNQPLLSYSYFYFNPVRGEPTNSLQDAIVPIEQYRDDVFAEYRPRQAAAVVGVSMTIRYVMETRPDHSATNSPSAF